ncbi:phosphatidylglycerophosphatase A [Marivita sp. GX14005]|uniref:phosphatidylglycerophosphatase A family protein n=1 Tax=Marivita sp. GX14005 TaxID=2942276 RepID=UPI002019E9B1|nr:phosphatidylglycerophosphatase A [Marivita sp. GX14005]MCL3883653.1 phosphatidylglycerophosphatase A [Marivita sp. GX14005]
MRLVASFFGAGWLKPAPGTWGSLAALPVGYALLKLGGPWLLAVAAVIVFFAGWMATRAVTDGMVDHDPSWIVIDEVVGQWIALFPVGYGAMMMGVPVERLWPGWLAAFVLFRLFDIWKPWLVGRADARGDALGVMMDDVFAGFFAAIGVIVLAALFHRVLM